jgi:hypothetical protein
MHPRLVLLVLSAALAAGCKSVDCGDGTIERNGACVPSSETVGNAKCGPFTRLAGDVCVPMLSPTVCDPSTTTEEIDEMGVTTCVGTGGGGCAARLACPTPADGKQTICGQLYDFENNMPFAQAGAMGTKCATGATSGPCALGMRAYDAVAFAMNPGTTQPLTNTEVYIDDCGRFRVSEITQPAGPFIALAIDDADPTKPGPLGITNSVGLATTKDVVTRTTRDFEAFVVRPATSAGWTGGPLLDSTHGIYAPIYRGHRTGTDLATGVTFTFGPMGPTQPTMTDVNRDFYFAAGSTNRTTLDAGVGATTTNGTALVSGATLAEQYSGQSSLPQGCIWDVHAGASIPFVIFIQIFRPTNIPSMTCSL